jgi:hypothetical protein
VSSLLIHIYFRFRSRRKSLLIWDFATLGSEHANLYQPECVSEENESSLTLRARMEIVKLTHYPTLRELFCPRIDAHSFNCVFRELPLDGLKSVTIVRDPCIRLNVVPEASDGRSLGGEMGRRESVPGLKAPSLRRRCRLCACVFVGCC